VKLKLHVQVLLVLVRDCPNRTWHRRHHQRCSYAPKCVSCALRPSILFLGYNATPNL